MMVNKNGFKTIVLMTPLHWHVFWLLIVLSVKRLLQQVIHSYLCRHHDLL